MITIDTLFASSVTIFVFYATMLITLFIAKNTIPLLHIKRIIVALTIVCLLFILVAFALCFELPPFLKRAVAKIQSISSIFAPKNFAWMFYLGYIPFLSIGIVCCEDAVESSKNIVVKVVDILFVLLAAIFIPYFINSLIYHFLYYFSWVVALILSLIINFFSSPLLIIVHVLLCENDE